MYSPYMCYIVNCWLWTFKYTWCCQVYLKRRWSFINKGFGGFKRKLSNLMVNNYLKLVDDSSCAWILTITLYFCLFVFCFCFCYVVAFRGSGAPQIYLFLVKFCENLISIFISTIINLINAQLFNIIGTFYSASCQNMLSTWIFTM